MNGAMLARQIEKQHQRFEDQREKWTEVREENGTPVEYLITNCEQCGQVWPRQRVVRFNEGELREWQTIVDKRTDSTMRLAMVFMPFVLLGIGIVAYWLSNSTFSYGVAAFVASLALYLCLVWRRDVRLTKESKEEKHRLLSRHGDIPEDDVGTADQYYKKYVILPVSS